MSNKTKRLSKKKINKILNGAGFTNAEVHQQDSSTGQSTAVLLEPKYFVKGDEELTKLTEQPKIKKILDEAVKEATRFHFQYVGWKRKLITSTAFHIEQYLRDSGQEHLKQRISELLIHVFKRVKGFVSAGYIQRELPTEYKRSDLNTADRRTYPKVKSETPGLPKDSGRTIEELKANLEHKTVKELLVILDSQVRAVKETMLQILRQGKSEGMDLKTSSKMIRKAAVTVIKISQEDLKDI